METKTLTIIKKNRKYFAATLNGYKCKILIDLNSETLELGEHNLILDDISVRSKYGTDLIYKLAVNAEEQKQVGICTLRHQFYNNLLVEECRKLGGRWDDQEKTWVFSTIVEDKVELLDEKFNSELLNLEVEVLNTVTQKTGPYCLFGRSIARAFNRDSGAILCDGMSLISGEVNSAGSSKNWRTVILEHSVLRFQVPKLLFEQLKGEYIDSGDFRFKIL